MNTPYRHGSIVPGDAEHLERWLAAARRCRPTYLERRVYGEYLSAAAEEASLLFSDSQGVLSLHKATIVSIDREGVSARGFVLRADSGAEFRARKVVLALGDPPPGPVPTAPGVACHPSPWPFERLDGLRRDIPVVLAGAGASAIDCCLYLVKDRGHQGGIEVWSRSGQLPCVQRDPSLPGVNVRRAAIDALVRSCRSLSLAEIKVAIARDLAAMFGDDQAPNALAGRVSADPVERFRARVAAAEAGSPSYQYYVRGLRDLAPLLWK